MKLAHLNHDTFLVLYSGLVRALAAKIGANFWKLLGGKIFWKVSPMVISSALPDHMPMELSILLEFDFIMRFNKFL